MTSYALNILIADDDEGDRKQIKRTLKQSGLPCECTETIDIGGALAACAKVAFDCAFIDYQLPGQDGLEGITALHARLPYMAIIMSTGQGNETVATEAMKRGATDYIPKKHIHADTIRRLCENAVEKATLQRQVAQQREELENFASMLVHDLKAPTRAIQGFAGIIETSIQEGKLEDIAADCRWIVQAAQRMDALIDTLHQYTRAKARVTFERVEMQQVMQDTLSNLGPLLQERGARVTHGDLPVVTGNAAQLIQLLQNLISNGIKYCKSEIPTVHVAASSKDGVWLLSVTDNGIGISAENYHKIFEPFRRLHSVSKYEGTGLGLATCKKIIERHGGDICCESEQGRGTTFFFTLPGAEPI
jgi:light-regulated signal transduction histidine kinase (bacteriophytochrome)